MFTALSVTSIVILQKITELLKHLDFFTIRHVECKELHLKVIMHTTAGRNSRPSQFDVGPVGLRNVQPQVIIFTYTCMPYSTGTV